MLDQQSDVNEIAETVREFVHWRLRLRIILYALIFVICIGIIIFDILRDNTSVLLPIGGGCIGIIVGFIATRVHRISWDHGAQQVIAQLDIIGVLILICYIFFEIYRDQIVGYFIHGPDVVAVSLAILAGIMIGRIAGMSHKIAKVINEQIDE